MTAWALILTPLLVLPIVLLFRFVGCGLDVVGTAEPDIPLPPRKPADPPATTPTPSPTVTKPPRYRDYIMGEPNNPGVVKNAGVVPNKADVIAYWRLVDPATASVAKDEKAFQDGQYKAGQALAFEAPTPTKAGSEAAAGNFVTGQDGLIVSEPTALCRDFNGGYVLVPFKAGLYTDEFTIEAWVEARPLKIDFEHTLFDAGGQYPIPPAAPSDHGFRIFEDRTGHWQVRLAPGTANLFPMPPLVPRPGATHLAVTVENVAGEIVPSGKKTVRMYLDGKEAATAVANSYSRPDGAPLFIGVENATLLPTSTVQLRRPVLMRIQEVVLHKKALSKEEIENHVDINKA